jgi:hypothetical protein
MNWERTSAPQNFPRSSNAVRSSHPFSGRGERPTPNRAERVASKRANPEVAAPEAIRRTPLKTFGSSLRAAETAALKDSQRNSKNVPANLLSAMTSAPLQRRSQLAENTQHNGIRKPIPFCQFRTATSYISWKSCEFCILRIGYRGLGVRTQTAPVGNQSQVRATYTRTMPLTSATPPRIGSIGLG